jgi:hypothetical protein
MSSLSPSRQSSSALSSEAERVVHVESPLPRLKFLRSRYTFSSFAGGKLDTLAR